MAYDLKHTGKEIDALLTKVEEGNFNITIDNELSETSNNAIANSAVAKALSDKVDKVEGKGLSTNDYTEEDASIVESVRDGSAITNNSDKVAEVVITTTDSEVKADGKAPVSGEAVDKAISKSFTADTVDISMGDGQEGIYLAGATTKQYTPISLFITKIISVKEGEKYRYTGVVGGASTALIILYDGDDNVVGVYDKGGDNTGTSISGEISIPSGVAEIAFTSRANGRDIYRISKVGKEVSIDELYYDSLDVKRQSMAFSMGCYELTVGDSPIKIDNKSYSSVVVRNMNNGDFVDINVHTGSSYYLYAKVSNGAVVECGGKGKATSGRLACDGTYDTLIINNYTSYNSSPLCTLYKSTAHMQNSIQKVVRVLCIGNSYTQDSMAYVPRILKSICPEIQLTLTIAYIGGSPLAQHYANLTNTDVTISGTTYTPTLYTIQEYSDEVGRWATTSNDSITNIIQSREWDIITLQQSGSTAHSSWDIHYAPYIHEIQRRIASLAEKNVTFAWIGIHSSYHSDATELKNRWESIVANTNKVLADTPTRILFPYGTAIQNLRTTPLAELGDGGNLTADGGHLHEGIACLTASYTNAMIIAQYVNNSYSSVIGDKFQPTKQWVEDFGVPGPNFGSSTNDLVGISDDNCYTAQVAAVMAVKYPDKVTDCNNSYREGDS